MVAVHPKYIIDEKEQRQAVILPESEWKLILQELEELEDIRSYDAVDKAQESIPFEQAVNELNG